MWYVLFSLHGNAVLHLSLLLESIIPHSSTPGRGACFCCVCLLPRKWDCVSNSTQTPSTWNWDWYGGAWQGNLARPISLFALLSQSQRSQSNPKHRSQTQQQQQPFSRVAVDAVILSAFFSLLPLLHCTSVLDFGANMCLIVGECKPSAPIVWESMIRRNNAPVGL